MALSDARESPSASRESLRTRAADLVREGFPQQYATTVPGGYVSTRLRQSSAMVNGAPWYFETMAFIEGSVGIDWQSAAHSAREADRQHDIAVRWFSR